MASNKITMIDQSQIAKKGYKGCKSTRSVQNFCAKNKSAIACCWYKPKGASQKILLIEASSFRDCWKATQKSTTAKSSTSTRGTSTTTRLASSTTGTRRARTTSASTKATARTSTRRTTAKSTTAKGTARKSTTSRTRTTRLRRAA